MFLHCLISWRENDKFLSVFSKMADHRHDHSHVGNGVIAVFNIMRTLKFLRIRIPRIVF